MRNYFTKEKACLTTRKINRQVEKIFNKTKKLNQLKTMEISEKEVIKIRFLRI